MAQAEELELDLVEINPNERPPICKIMDYGKHKYEIAKRDRERKKTRHVQETKEVKFSPKIGNHDFTFKLKHVRAFIEEGNRVRMVVRFRGREVTHPETGRAILERVCTELAEIVAVVQTPTMEQRQMSMLIGPNAKTSAQAKAAS
jgi:translation initiation factor IF-3